MGLENIPPKRMLFEFILPNISKYLNLGKEDTYQDIITKIIAIFILAFLVFVGSIIIVKL